MAAQIIACSQCGRMLVIPDEWQGMVMRCPTCGDRFVTGPDAEPQPVPDTPPPVAESVSAPPEELPEPPPAPAAPVSEDEDDYRPLRGPVLQHDGQFLPALQPLEPDSGSEEERPRRHHLETGGDSTPKPPREKPTRQLVSQRFLEPEDLVVPEPKPEPEPQPQPKVKEPPPPRPRPLPPLEGPSQTGKVVLLLLGIFGFLLIIVGLILLIAQLSQLSQ
jgi:hypothetical protein